MKLVGMETFNHLKLSVTTILKTVNIHYKCNSLSFVRIDKYIVQIVLFLRLSNILNIFFKETNTQCCTSQIYLCNFFIFYSYFHL